MKHRLELFTEGFYSIVITLLVLELHTPDKPGWDGWWAMRPSLAAYLLTFGIVGSSYLLSVIVLRAYREFTAGMLWLFLSSLAAVALIPLLLKNLVEHMGDPAALMMLVAIIGVAAIPPTIIRYAVPRAFIADPKGWPAYMRQRNRSILPFWIGIFITIGLTYLNFWVGFTFYCALVAVLTVLMGRELNRALGVSASAKPS